MNPTVSTQSKQLNLNQNYFHQNLSKLFEKPLGPTHDPIFKIVVQHFNDMDPTKINLSNGTYKDQNGQSYVFKVVRDVQKLLCQDLNKDYLPDNLKSYCVGSQKIVFGKDSPAISQQRIATTQTLSGTGAFYVAFNFISRYLPEIPKKVYISQPGWPTHKNILEVNGFEPVYYPYYEPELKNLNFNKMLQFLRTIQKGSIVVLQTAGHNPTGFDLVQNQWKQLCQLMKQRQLIPFFDPAYQGFASGDLQKDGWPIRYFLNQRFLMFVAQSYSKNLGLYGERIGALHVVTPNKDIAQNIYKKLKNIDRQMYLSPPSHGTYLVDKIINNQQRYNEWVTELKNVVAHRILKARQMLRFQLQKINTPGKWDHITTQIGMFSFTGLTEKQCQILIQKYHIYLVENGRISMSGVNQHNCQRIAECIKKCIEQSGQ